MRLEVGEVGCCPRVGEGLLTGDAEPLGEPSLRINVDDIVFRAACFCLSVFTKLDTRSSRFPFRFGEARSSRGPTSEVMWVREEPRAGDSRVLEVGDDTELLWLWRGEWAESSGWTALWPRSGRL